MLVGSAIYMHPLSWGGGVSNENDPKCDIIFDELTVVGMFPGWLVEPKSRLTFTQIREEMTKMYEDADRYFEVQVTMNRYSFAIQTIYNCSLSFNENSIVLISQC